MANRTVKDALSVRGTNPQYLIEKIIRSRIYDSRYWKEECFALSAELLVDKAMDLKYVGGVHAGNIKPSPFLCLILKMLQIQPEKDIVIEFIRQENFKYVRALGAMYMRLVGTSLDCYKYLEPLYNDYRKLRRQTRQATFEVVHTDEFIDELLHEERVCDVILPRIQKRQVLEDLNELVPRISALEDDLEGPDSEEDDKDGVDPRSISRKTNRSKSTNSPVRRRRSPHRRDYSSRQHSFDDRERDRHRRRSRSHEKERPKGRSNKDRRYRSRSRSVEKKSHDRKSGHSSSKHSHKSREEKERRRNMSSMEDDYRLVDVNSLRSRLGLAPLK